MTPAIANFLEITSILLMYFMASDFYWNRYYNNGKIRYQYITGLVQGLVGILLITKKVAWMEYCTSLDTRAVVICLTGIIFGRIPTMVSVGMMSAFTAFYESDTASMLLQIAYSVAVAIVSLSYGDGSHNWDKKEYYRHISICAFICQGIVYASVLLTPSENRYAMATETILPVLIMMPATIILLSTLLYSSEQSRRTKRELTEAKDKFNKITICANDCIWELDITGMIKYVTGNTSGIIGYNNEELIGLMPHSLMSDSESMNTLMEFTASNNKDIFESQLTLTHRKGYNVYCSARGLKLYDHLGHLTGYIGIIRDNTEQHLHDMLRKNNEKLMREQNAEFRRLNEELRINYKESKRTNQILMEANAKVKESQNQQFEFLTIVTNEITDPINDISNIIDSISSNTISPEVRRQAIQKIKDNCEYINTLIGDITNTDIINKGLMRIKLSVGNVAEMLTEIYEYFYYRNMYVDKKPIYLKSTMDLPGEDCMIRTDFLRLRQVINKLISNAYKFTVSGKIFIDCKLLNDNELMFSVTDTGMGIPEGAYGYVFTPYSKSNSDTTPHHTGLGLSVAKTIVEMMGGRIWFESETGKGTSFHFTIPYIKATEVVDTEKSNYNWGKANLLIAGCDRYNNILICNKILTSGARFCNFIIDPQSSSRISLDTSYFSSISLMIIDERVMQTPAVMNVLSRYPNAPVITTSSKIKINELCKEIDLKIKAMQ